MRTILSESQIGALEEKVYTLLEDVGLRIENDEIVTRLEARGCRRGADERVRICRELLHEIVREQERRREEQRKNAARHDHSPSPPKRAVMSAAFSPGPTKCYDYDRKQTVAVDTQVFTDMVKFADATDEVERVHLWFRQDVPGEVENLEDLVAGLKLSKKMLGVDAILPGHVKYLIEIGEIVTGQPGSTKYLAGSQCITPPLILGWRSAGELVARAECGVKSCFLASMMMIGLSTPVTLGSAVLMTAAEVLGGWAAAYVVNPDAVITGGAYATSLDMITGNGTICSPEVALVNAAAKELFDARFGGHLGVGIRYSPCAGVPGLQAVYENFFDAYASGLLAGSDYTYPGNGLLDNGRVGSPLQLLLDIEIIQSLAALDQEIPTDDAALAFDLVCETVKSGKDFLATRHTAEHCREMWQPRLFLRNLPGPLTDQGAGSEQAILDRCNDQWKANLARYEPPEWPSETLRDLDNLMARAREEFLG